MSPLKKIIFIIAQNITKKVEKTHLVKYIFLERVRKMLSARCALQFVGDFV